MTATRGVANTETLPRNNPKALHWVARTDRRIAREVGATHTAALCGLAIPLTSPLLGGRAGMGKRKVCARCDWLHDRLPD